MLFIYCEGPTEEFFVSRILNPNFLSARGKHAVPVKADGLRPFGRVRSDLLDLLRNPEAKVTTLIDYYAMPPDYPGMPHQALPPGNKSAAYAEVARLEAALANAIDNPRFIANYALHEFEALAFAEPLAIDEQRARVGGDSIVNQVRQILATAGDNPELVNDSAQTSPSHRLESLWPANQYQKTVDSIGIVQRIPFPRIRDRCPHFREWLDKL
jgi:hypothetical protein